MESRSLKDKKDKDWQEKIDKIGKVTKDVSKGIYNGATEAPENIAKNIKKPFIKKKECPDEKNESN